MVYRSTNKKWTTGGIVAMLTVLFTLFCAWITHIVVCLKLVLGGSPDMFWKALVVLILGLVVPFIGWIHGIMIWFGSGLG